MNPPTGGCRRRPASSPAAGWSPMRTRAAIQGPPRPLTASLASSPTSGSRRVVRSTASWSASMTQVDHNGAPLRQERTAAGVGGLPGSRPAQRVRGSRGGTGTGFLAGRGSGYRGPEGYPERGADDVQLPTSGDSRSSAGREPAEAVMRTPLASERTRPLLRRELGTEEELMPSTDVLGKWLTLRHSGPCSTLAVGRAGQSEPVSADADRTSG